MPNTSRISLVSIFVISISLLGSVLAVAPARAAVCGGGSTTGDAPPPLMPGEQACPNPGGVTQDPPQMRTASATDYRYMLGGEAHVDRHGVYAALNVVDTEVPHPANGAGSEYFKQSITVASCNSTDLRVFEAGWAEVSWLPGQTQQYLFTRTTPGGYLFFVNPSLVHAPGERVYVEIIPLGGGLWGAYANSNRTGAWMEMGTFSLGSDSSCLTRQSVEMFSGTKHYQFSPVEFGNGTSTGVMVRPTSTQDFVAWDPSTPTSDFSEDGNGAYNVDWRAFYYHSFVTSRKIGPTAVLNVSPPSGDITTEFVASLARSFDADQDPLSYRIDWGDGTVEDSSSSRHTYDYPGEYVVTGTVDDGSARSTVERVVEVCAAATGCQGGIPPPETDSPLGAIEWGEDVAHSTPVQPTMGQLYEATAEARTQLGIDEYEEVGKFRWDELSASADEVLLDEYRARTTAERELVSSFVRDNLTTLAKSGGYDLNLAETAVCIDELANCGRALQAAEEARDWARRYYPNHNGKNDIRDAFRHCQWSALMTRRTSETYAEKMGRAHEENPESRQGQMDLYNNSKGRTAGSAADLNKEGARDMANRCRDYARTGGLIISLKDGRID